MTHKTFSTFEYYAEDINAAAMVKFAADAVKGLKLSDVRAIDAAPRSTTFCTVSIHFKSLKTAEEIARLEAKIKIICNIYRQFRYMYETFMECDAK